jgi:hypothetical protein
MSRQNRVTPWGAIIATPERGTFMGNRGVLHEPGGRVVRPWQVRRWLLCVLEFRGRKRTVMSPGHYTELFFLDEATGLAAGHRPCWECRRQSFLDFRDAWLAGNRSRLDPREFTADRLDQQLHAERVGPGRSKRTFTAEAGTLPDGVFVRLKDGEDDAWLVRGGKLLAWSPAGYGERRPLPKGKRVSVLTPPSTVEAIRAGYAPEIHESARPG